MSGPTAQVFADINARVLEIVSSAAPNILLKTGALAITDSDSSPRIVLVPLTDSYSAPPQTSDKSTKLFAMRRQSCVAHIWGDGSTQEEARDQIEELLIPALVEALRTYKATSVVPMTGQWATEQTPGYRHDGALYLLNFDVLLLVGKARYTARATSTTLTGVQVRADGTEEGVVPDT